MRIENDIKLDFSDVLIRPKRSTINSRKDVEISRSFKFRNEVTYHFTPIIAANMDGVGTFEMADKLSVYGMLTALSKHYSEKELIEADISRYHILTIGPADYSKYILIREERIMKNKIPFKFVCIDVANGYHQNFIDFIKMFRDHNPSINIIAGNVCTPELTEELLVSGADVVKVGIGPGSVCTTRLKTGVGYPQLSAIIECADAAHGLGGYIVADGGCTTSGDIAKAFGAGADFVMLGGMLAGHKEGGGETNNQGMISFYGSSSNVAMELHHNGKADYRAAEGKLVEIPYKGAVSVTVEEILGGLRSACSYTGSKNLKELPKRTTFVRVNNTHNKVFEKYDFKD